MVGSSWFLTAKDVSLFCTKDYDARVRSCMLHRSETWSLKRENELALHWTLDRNENDWMDVWCEIKG